jgi:hypothetical protein
MAPKCLKCRRNDLVRRSHRTPAEMVLAFIFLYPFRCERCDNRFYRFSKPDKVAAERLKVNVKKQSVSGPPSY